MVKIKKNARRNFLFEVKHKLWVLLPLLMIVILLVYIFVEVVIFKFAKEEDKVNAKNIELRQELSEYESKKDVLLAYSNLKWVYDKYSNGIINLDLVFNTIENYIPKKSDRTNITINKNANIITTTVNTEVKSYKDYMSYLRVIDKCSFTSEKQKKSLLNVQKVELSNNGDDVELSTPVSVNLSFEFNSSDNEFIVQKKYDDTIKELNDIWKFIYFINIVKWDINDVFDINKTEYNTELKRFYEEKKLFVEDISKIQNTDSNWFFKAGTGENFINKIKRENILIDYLISYYNEYKTNISQNNLKIFNNWDIIHQGENNWKLLFNLKERNNEKILDINRKILELELIKRYNNYLLDQNYLDNFEKLKTTPKKYQIVVDNEEKTVSWNEYIEYVIDEYWLVLEDDILFNSIINSKKYEEKKDEDWNIFTEITEISNEDIEKQIKLEYTNYYNFIKDIENKKLNILNTNKFFDNFFKEYVTYNNYIEWVEILDYFFKNWKDEAFLNSIRYTFLDFRIQWLNTFKKRFLLTIENNNQIANNINLINSLDLFVKQLDITENFVKKTTDIVLSNNNNINCLTTDIKKDTNNIYNSILDERQKEKETNEKIKEIDIIINNFWN